MVSLWLAHLYIGNQVCEWVRMSGLSCQWAMGPHRYKCKWSTLKIC